MPVLGNVAFTFHVKLAELASDLEDLTPRRARSRLLVRSCLLRSTVLGLMMPMVRSADFTLSDEGYYLNSARQFGGAHRIWTLT